MFGRKQSPADEEPSVPVAEDHDPRSPKGRPTPSRKEAEAARKPWPSTPAEAAAWRFDGAAQTWSKP